MSISDASQFGAIPVTLYHIPAQNSETESNIITLATFHREALSIRSPNFGPSSVNWQPKDIAMTLDGAIYGRRTALTSVCLISSWDQLEVFSWKFSQKHQNFSKL